MKLITIAVLVILANRYLIVDRISVREVAGVVFVDSNSKWVWE